eukprot:455162-Pyramimonas_sp.AAC.1
MSALDLLRSGWCALAAHQEARRSIIGTVAAQGRGSCAASSASKQARARTSCDKNKGWCGKWER